MMAAALLERTRVGIAFTGAGISVESGIPHFRGEGGLWTKFDPYKVAHIDTFGKDPSQYWTYSRNHRRPDAEPNPAHRALVELERLGHLRAVITQNTDGLHQRAGSKEVIELHGSSHSVICLDCEARFPRDQVDEMNRAHCPPSCPACGGQLLKPTVVLFGEALPVPALREAQALAMAAHPLSILATPPPPRPAPRIPPLARQHGAQLCIVNPEPTPFDEVASAVIHGKAGEVLPEIVGRMASG